MKRNLPISQKKKFKYFITFQSFDEESLEAGDSFDRGYETEDTIDLIGDILYKAYSTYGIYMPVAFGTWESTNPLENTDFYEKGIQKYFAIHITNEDDTQISQEENDFITFILSDGNYELNKFREYAVGGIVLGSIALGIGALITYFYFKGKKGNKNGSTNNRAKSVTHTINGKKRTFPIKDAWKKEHTLENKSENYEVPQEDRFEMGGDASQHYHEIEYGEGGVARAKDIITKKIGFNEIIADYLIYKSEKFAIWLADSILKQEIAEREENKSVVLESLNQRSYSVNTNFINNNYGGSIREVLDWLQHPITPKQNLKELSFDQALEKAREWHNELQVLGGDIDFTEPETNTILKKYPVNSDGIEYYWVFIPSNYCDLESSRMGHCGRTGYGNKLISLRSVKPYGKGHTISDSHVTIAYGSDGTFYQVKGKKNNKPSEKYFPYIFDLIKSIISENGVEYSKESMNFDKTNKLYNEIRVLGFNGFGSEYQSSEDYGFEDMTKEEIREIYDLKPTLFESAEDNYMLLDAGVITLDEFKEIVEREPDTFSSFGNQMKLYERGIITQQPSTSFELKYDCDDVYRLLDISRDFSDDLVAEILCGDIGELYDSWSYYYDNPSDLVSNLNKENEQSVIDEIVRITKLDESVVKENGITYYLNGEDENFSPNDDFDNIIRTLASAQSQADNNDYYNYLYKAVESALNELGEVNSLNDEGVKMTIELNNYMSLEEIAEGMDYYEFSDVEDLFNEKLDSEIDKPRLSIDDRYSPYGSSKDFNEYISYIDLEQGYEKGGEVILFNRYASMDSATISELREMTKYPFLLEYDIDENGKKKYDRIESALVREGVSTGIINNYLSGLFDGYNYSNTKSFKKEMAKLKLVDKEFYDKVMTLYEKISKYPKINLEYANGGRVTTNDGIIESFLISNKQLKVGNLSTHFNEYDNQMLLRNYGTLITTRKGNDIEITNTKYSKTTTTITNKIRNMALKKRINITYVDKFADGGKVNRKFMSGGMNEGGGTYVDLFEDYKNIPPKVQAIIDKYAEEFEDDFGGMDYQDTQNMLEEIEAVGYTFDYYLDNVPYGLRPLGVRLNQLKNYEDYDDDKMAKGGGVGDYEVGDTFIDGVGNRLTIVAISEQKGYKMISKDSPSGAWYSKDGLNRFKKTKYEIPLSSRKKKRFDEGGGVCDDDYIVIHTSMNPELFIKKHKLTNYNFEIDESDYEDFYRINFETYPKNQNFLQDKSIQEFYYEPKDEYDNGGGVKRKFMSGGVMPTNYTRKETCKSANDFNPKIHKFISGDADFYNSKIENLGNLQMIGGSADFSYSKVKNLGNLQTIGGGADFGDSQITNLGNLQTIGGGADFYGSQITDLGNLQTIGGRAYFGKRTDLEAEWEKIKNTTKNKFISGGITQNSWMKSGDANLSIAETKKVAKKYAEGLSMLGEGRYSVNPKVEENSFDLDFNDEEYNGGSYNIFGDGSVVNMAVNPSERYGSINSTPTQIKNKVIDIEKQLKNAEFKDLIRNDGSVYGKRMVSELKFSKGGETEDNWNGKYLTISANKNRMVIKLTNEGREQVNEMMEDEKSDSDIMYELFQDITANSELIYHSDLGDSGFGLTSASGITDGYYYNDNGDFEELDETARLYYFNDYALRSEIDDLLNGELFLNGADNQYAEGGLAEHGLMEGDKIIGTNGYQEDEIFLIDRNNDTHIVNLDKGIRMEKGGKAGGGGKILVTEYSSQKDYEKNNSITELSFSSFEEADNFARKEKLKGRKFVVYNIPTSQLFYYGLKEIMSKGGKTGEIKDGDSVIMYFNQDTELEIFESEDLEEEPYIDVFKKGEKFEVDIFGVDDTIYDVQFGDGDVAFIRKNNVTIVSVNDKTFASGGEAGENLENYSDYDEFYNVVFEYIKREENLTEEETKDICITNESIIEAEFDGGSSPRFTGDVVLGYLSNERGYMKKGGKAGKKSTKKPIRKKPQPKMVRQYFEDEAYAYADGGEIKLKIKNLDSFDEMYDEVGFTKKELSLPKQDSNENWFTTTKDKSIAEQLILGGFVEKYDNGGYVEGGSADLSTKEKAIMYVWIDNFLEKYSDDDNLSQSLDMYKEFAKKFNKSTEQTDNIIDSGWASSRGYYEKAQAIKKSANKSYVMTDDTYVNIFLSRGFTEKRSSYGLRFFEHKPTGIYITYDPRGIQTPVIISTNKSGEESLYEGNTIREVKQVLDNAGATIIKEGIDPTYAGGGETDDDDDSGAIQEQLDELVQDFSSEEYQAFCYEHDIEEEDAQEMSDFIYSQTNNRCKEIIQEIEDGYYAGGYDDMEVDEYAEGGKTIGIAKTHPESLKTETYVYPTGERVPSKFYDELGIKLENEKDYVLVLEIWFDTKEVILQSYYGSDGENYDGTYKYNVNDLSEEFLNWLNSSLIKDIRKRKGRSKYAGGGVTFSKDRNEDDSYKISIEFQKVIDSDFDEKIYNNYQKIVKETEIPIKSLQEIELYVTTTPKNKRRMIDTYKYWSYKPKGNYAEGGKVQDWMKEALDSLMEETGNDKLEITYVVDSKIKYEFMASDGDVEYRVFQSEDDAEQIAVEQVREDLEENAEYFNKDWLMNYIDGRDFFEEALNEMNDGYVQDIESESDSKYANRLIAELVENGLMDEEDAESDNAEELANELKYDYVALLTEERLDEGNDGLDYFISNFGETETYKMVRENNLINLDDASQDAVDIDGIGHFLSSYDGETLYLLNNNVAYRNN